MYLIYHIAKVPVVYCPITKRRLYQIQSSPVPFPEFWGMNTTDLLQSINVGNRLF